MTAEHGLHMVLLKKRMKRLAPEFVVFGRHPPGFPEGNVKTDEDQTGPTVFQIVFQPLQLPGTDIAAFAVLHVMKQDKVGFLPVE